VPSQDLPGGLDAERDPAGDDRERARRPRGIRGPRRPRRRRLCSGRPGVIVEVSPDGAAAEADMPDDHEATRTDPG